MDIDDSPQDAAFRSEVRGFLQLHLAELVHHTHADPRNPEEVELYKKTQRLLYDGGLVGATWPSEYGGRDASSMHQVIINQELAAIGVPPLVGQIGLGMCGPTIISHGTEAQKSAYLAKLLDGTHVWSQLFSEPGAGSDLAGISTRATQTESGWLLNGQKVWTSGAHYSDWGIVLTRTDTTVAKHRGLTMFILDLRSPGVTVRPLRQMTGESAFNEVFFEDVQIPAENLLGAVNGGWGVALTTLLNERMAIGGGGNDLGGSIEQFLALADEKLPGFSTDEQAVMRQDIGRLYTLLLACRWTGYRRLTALSRGETPGPEASAGKVAATPVGREITQLAVTLLGDDAAFNSDANGSGPWQYVQSILPGLALAGGATEILKNVIGERVLGLSQEPRVDKAVPTASAAPLAPPLPASAPSVLLTTGS